MKKFLDWLKSYWAHPCFRGFIYLFILDMYMIIFHYHVYQEFLNNIANNSGLVVGIVAIVNALIPFLFRKKDGN